MRDLLELLEYSILNSAAGSAEYALFATIPLHGQDGNTGYSSSSSYWGSFGRDGAASALTNVSGDVALRDVFEMYYGLR